MNTGGRDCWGLANHTEYAIISVLNMRKLRLGINNCPKSIAVWRLDMTGDLASLLSRTYSLIHNAMLSG